MMSDRATRLARAGERHARLEGRQETLAQRRDELTRDVGAAKGRLLIKREVEQFIDEIQSEAGRRRIGSFETLLSALVTEVLPDEKPIALTLSTERGMPALDISSRHPSGKLEDVLNDQGGALTNVVVMGLRLIAVMKSGLARFVALDEPDCWVAPERVPSFFRVLQDAATRLGLQCLAVSHHDLQKFDPTGARISRIVGVPKSESSVHCEEPLPVWEDHQPGIRWIRLINVQAYADTTLHLCPGVNFINGNNNLGKSVFIRALRAVFMGETSDSLVRHDSQLATIEIGLAGRRTLRFTRQPRRNPINLWTLLEEDGSVAEEAGVHHETGGREAPGWLSRIFPVQRIENLDVQISHQKTPVFLLGESPSRRASVLSIGQESDYARLMLAVHKERSQRDQQVVRDGERELGRVLDILKALEVLGAIKADIEILRALATEIADGEGRLSAVEQVVSRLTHLRSAQTRLAATGVALRGLPASADLDGITERQARVTELDRLATIIERASGIIAKATRESDVLDHIPEQPVFEPIDRQMQLARKIAGLLDELTLIDARDAALAELPAMPELAQEPTHERIAHTIDAARKRLTDVEQQAAAIASEEADIRRQMEALSATLGNRCPTCGCEVTAEALLDHIHGVAA
jgi:hypothetical protein